MAAQKIVQAQKTWHMVDPQIEVTGSIIPYADPESKVRYLGINIDPWRGLSRTSSKEIIDAGKAVKRVKLKPHQKVNLIRTYLLLRYIHKLVANPSSLGTLRQIDTILLTNTNKWRHFVCQGQGIKEFFGDKIGNSWLYKPELLKPSRYLNALKIRTKTVGTRVALNRARKDLDVNCR